MRYYHIMILAIGVIMGTYTGSALKVKAENPKPSEAAKRVATFAGGCFWCMEPPFENLEGVSAVISGYMGGKESTADYTQVSSGKTEHAEVVQVHYDPQKVSYETLLDVFWRNIDPTTKNQQFVDKGPQYRTGIFYHSEEQLRLAEQSKVALDEQKVFDGPIVTEVTAASSFYPAEDYHQDYYKKNPVRYKYYRYLSGRDQYLEKTWDEDE